MALNLGTPPTSKRKTKIETLMEELLTEDAEALLDALANPLWAAEPLSQTLRGQGIDLAQTTIRAWRRARRTVSSDNHGTR